MAITVKAGRSCFELRSGVMAAAIIVLCAGCAAGPHVEFELDWSLKGAELSERERPAELTTKSEAHLLIQEGYISIGKIVVQYDKEVSYDTTLNELVCQEAAKKGGDIVRLTVDRKEKNVTRYKSGECIRQETQTTMESVPDYETYCIRPNVCNTRQTGSHSVSRTSKVCVKWNQIPYEVAVIESEGQVYRKNTDKRVYVVQGGLTWMPTTSFTANWANAKAYCTSTTINGQTGWRLPTRAELSALITSGAMNGKGWDFRLAAWSSTLVSAGIHSMVSLKSGIVSGGNDTWLQIVSCVR